jgi:AcrR family transcriptional regulator
MSGQTKKSRERRQEILKAAQILFHIKGFQNTSINDIMKHIGAAKGVFYYYFETKEQVLDTLVDMLINETVVAMSIVLERADMNALQKLKYILQEEFRISMENITPDYHIHNIKNVDMHQKIFVSMVNKQAPLIGQIVEQGIQEGIFKTKYPLEVSEIIIAGTHFITDLGIFDWNKEEYLRRIRASEELIEKALCIEEGSLHFLSEMLSITPDMVEKNKQKS